MGEGGLELDDDPVPGPSKAPCLVRALWSKIGFWQMYMRKASDDLDGVRRYASKRESRSAP